MAKFDLAWWEEARATAVGFAHLEHVGLATYSDFRRWMFKAAKNAEGQTPADHSPVQVITALRDWYRHEQLHLAGSK